MNFLTKNDKATVDLNLLRMVRAGEAEVTAETEGDRYRLTESGKRGVESTISMLVSEYTKTENWASIMKDLAGVMIAHGILPVVGQKALLLRRGQFSFELRFQFIGGNKKLCNLQD